MSDHCHHVAAYWFHRCKVIRREISERTAAEPAPWYVRAEWEGRWNDAWDRAHHLSSAAQEY